MRVGAALILRFSSGFIFCRFDVIARKQGEARMSVLTYAIASDDDVDAASARTGKKEHVRSDRMTGAANAADAQNIKKSAAYARSEART